MAAEHTSDIMYVASGEGAVWVLMQNNRVRSCWVGSNVNVSRDGTWANLLKGKRISSSLSSGLIMRLSTWKDLHIYRLKR